MCFIGLRLVNIMFEFVCKITIFFSFGKKNILCRKKIVSLQFENKGIK